MDVFKKIEQKCFDIESRERRHETRLGHFFAAVLCTDKIVFDHYDHVKSPFQVYTSWPYSQIDAVLVYEDGLELSKLA